MDKNMPKETIPAEAAQNDSPSEKRGVNRKLMMTIAIATALFSMGAAAWLKVKMKNHDADKAGMTQADRTDNQPAASDRQDEGIDYWTCSMHPFVKQKRPGACPICAMDLIPVKKGESGSADAAAESTFMISPQRLQLIGVRLTEVQPQELEKTIRTVGNVAVDETRVAEAQAKFSGWIEQVFANQTGQHVKKGDPLFTIYSPELVATQEEYLLAWRAAKDFKEGPYKEIAGMDSLLAAARRRLARWDISDEQINALEETGSAQRALTIYAPATGHIIMKNALPNMQVTPEAKIYTIADHSAVWANVDVYETDIGLIKIGQSAKMTVPAYPDKVFWGKVTFIWPHLDSQTRTLKVRLEFSNPGLLLKPEMYANVELQIPLDARLVIPESAVIRTGKQNIVFVSLGDGRFSLRNVKLGMKIDGQYEALDGLAAGEKIVAAANFLVDAESKLQGVKSSWEGEMEQMKHK